MTDWENKYSGELFYVVILGIKSILQQNTFFLYIFSANVFDFNLFFGPIIL